MLDAWPAVSAMVELSVCNTQKPGVLQLDEAIGMVARLIPGGWRGRRTCERTGMSFSESCLSHGGEKQTGLTEQGAEELIRTSTV